VLRDGKNVQEGPPFEVYHKPQDAWVGRFLGRASFVTGQVQSKTGKWMVSTELGLLLGEVPNALQREGLGVSVLLRPDDLIHDDFSETRFPVVQRFFRGIYQIYVLKLPSGALVQCLAPSHHNHPLGEPMGVRLEVDHLVLFAEP
jgi:iron(III) transport system ATP-binding protein